MVLSLPAELLSPFPLPLPLPFLSPLPTLPLPAELAFPSPERSPTALPRISVIEERGSELEPVLLRLIEPIVLPSPAELPSPLSLPLLLPLPSPLPALPLPAALPLPSAERSPTALPRISVTEERGLELELVLFRLIEPMVLPSLFWSQ